MQTLFKKGEKIAVLSPSAGTAGVFPWVFEQGLERLKQLLHVDVVEYPTTRQPNAPLRDRADDINSAFANDNIAGIFTAIGGNDQIQLLKYLNADAIIKNPKPFFGYSDNTHLHNYLWKLNIPTYYGGAILTQFAMGGKMDEHTIQSLRNVLSQRKQAKIEPSEYFSEVDLDWADKNNLSRHKQVERNDGFQWDVVSPQKTSGKLWGGCVESMITLLGSGHAPSDDALKGMVLFLETSESMPEPWVVKYVLVAMGERGMLENCNGFFFGRAKAWDLQKQTKPSERCQYREEQTKIVRSTIRMYNNTAPIIQNMDFGHTDPQSIIPMGNTAYIDSESKTVLFDY